MLLVVLYHTILDINAKPCVCECMYVWMEFEMDLLYVTVSVIN